MPASHQPIANDVFKQRSGRNIWGGTLAAVAVHALLFAFAPTATVTNLGAAAAVVDVIDIGPVIPPEPPPIEKIRHPGVPVVGDIDADVTIADNTDLYDTRELLAGPPPLARNAGAEIDAFMPRDVNPVLRNTREVQRLLERTYPPLLRDAGIGGTVQVWFYIDESGTVRQTRLHASSGYAALDRAALDVADAMEFGPAMLRARPVPVWVSIPIVFTAR